MAFRVVLFAYRKPGTAPQDFKHHYETIHVPLVKQMAGDVFPLKHSRRYISRPNTSSHGHAAEVISGDASDVQFDAITEMEFESRDDFYKFATLLSNSDNAARIAEDCAAFLDTGRSPTMIVLEDTCETGRNSGRVMQT